MNLDKEYYIYILRCCDGSLYTGITRDVKRRMAEHSSKAPKGAKYTRSRGVSSLEAVWKAPDRVVASKLEYYIKSLPRSKKLALISSGEALDGCQRIYQENLST